MRIFPTSLQGKFLVGLVLIMLAMGCLFAFALERHTTELLASEAREKANLMMAHTQAIQSYVRNIQRPAVSRAIPEESFIIEAMSTSFITRHILSNLSLDPDSFYYRRVAKNARNPDYEVNAQEEQIFNSFAADPSLESIEKTTKANGKEHFIKARPVYFSEDCMRCHGTPEDAPAVLLQVYGSERGFYRKAGELAGLDMVSIPLQNSTGAVTKSATIFAIWFGAGMLLLLLIIQGYFNRLVVHNLRRVGGILQRIFFQEENADLLAPLQQEEEIEGMIHSIETIATHLGTAREQLNSYAKNLESMVQERTSDLEQVVAARSADVALFLKLLYELNQHGDKKLLLSTALNLMATHFQASSAFYACSLSGSDFLVWPFPTPDQPPTQANELTPASLHALSLLALEEPVIKPDCWLLPVQTSGQTRGVLGLFWQNKAHMPKRTNMPLASAFGTQLGLALDNLEALDTLLRQNTLLDSLVEGVPDPLILMDPNGLPLLANTSARTLALRLCRQKTLHLDSSIDASPLSEPDTPDSDSLLASLLQRLGAFPDEGNAPMPRQIWETSLQDGTSFAIGLYPFTDAEQHTRTIVHIHETTKEKELLNHLRRSEKLAAVGQLAASIAHEINNPLGVIRCYAELLEKSLKEEQELNDINTIIKHVESAQSVLRDLLRFSRPKAGSSGPCDVEALLQSLADLFKPKAASARVELSVTIPLDLPKLQTDCGMLEQIMVNLLLNALDAAPQGTGKVSLNAFKQNNTLCIEVVDNGGGIAEADLGKIFDPFFSTKAPGTGTGLGLTVAFGMATEMGGSLEVRNHYENEQRVGAIFTIALPLIRPESSHEPE